MASFRRDRMNQSHKELIDELDRTLDTLNDAILLVQSKIEKIKETNPGEEE